MAQSSYVVIKDGSGLVELQKIWLYITFILHLAKFILQLAKFENMAKYNISIVMINKLSIKDVFVALPERGSTAATCCLKRDTVLNISPFIISYERSITVDLTPSTILGL